MPFPIEMLPIVVAIVLFGYVVLAVGGFGSSLVSMPLLALVLPLKVVVPLMLLLDFTGMLSQGVRLRRDLDRKEMAAIIPPQLVGLVAGVAALVWLPGRALLVALGVFILAYAVHSLRSSGPRKAIARVWAIPAGLFGGLIGGMFGTGGAVFALYFALRIPDAARMRATLSAVFVVNTGTRLLLFLLSGLLLQSEVWIGYLVLVPFVWAGLFIGHRLHGRLTPAQVARAVSVLLLFSGMSVLVKGLGLAG
jgi:uncharacterized membrane protein YfcA